jgi:hypothetical protein
MEGRGGASAVIARLGGNLPASVPHAFFSGTVARSSRFLRSPIPSDHLSYDVFGISTGPSPMACPSRINLHQTLAPRKRWGSEVPLVQGLASPAQNRRPAINWTPRLELRHAFDNRGCIISIRRLLVAMMLVSIATGTRARAVRFRQGRDGLSRAGAGPRPRGANGSRFRHGMMLTDDLQRHADAAIESRRILDNKLGAARVHLERARTQPKLTD